MAIALSDAEIKAGLAKLNGWARDGDELVKEFRFDNYLAGLAFAAGVGVIAEGLNHHPDLLIGWRRVKVSFTTHDAGGKITAKDFAAAEAIDGLGYPST
ncbi:MAG: 4a-hydroxytetrahydrobiopterin dehydratase [Chloroflexi bacterium]|nr:4a-hydroxytetrahydrobiopterin dehydratase [Chloroflexota bacterium]